MNKLKKYFLIINSVRSWNTGSTECVPKRKLYNLLSVPHELTITNYLSSVITSFRSDQYSVRVTARCTPGFTFQNAVQRTGRKKVIATGSNKINKILSRASSPYLTKLCSLFLNEHILFIKCKVYTRANGRVVRC